MTIRLTNERYLLYRFRYPWHDRKSGDGLDGSVIKDETTRKVPTTKVFVGDVD